MARAFSHLNFPHVPKINLQPSISKSSNTRPIRMTIQDDTHHYWTTKEAKIEAHLKKAIPVRPPVQVFEPMHDLIMTAPKTRAAALCLATCELIGGDNSCNDTVAAASALHLVHAAACIHEQLPLTDRPSLNPNVNLIGHHAYGANIELLTGDGIVPFGFELLARSVDPVRDNAGQVLHVIVELSHAVKTLVDGQWEEIEIRKSNGWDDARIEHVWGKKEGGLYACGAACGAILGGGSEEEIERLKKYGLYVGIIQGFVNNVGVRNANKKGLVKRVEELRVLAMEELEHFKGRNVGPISSLVHVNLDDFLK